MKELVQLTEVSKEDLPEIYCDLDEVLVDFMRGADAAVGGSFVKMDKDERWNRVNQTKDFWANLGWKPNAKRLHDFIIRYNPHVLSAYTGRDPTSKVGKMKWLKKNTGFKRGNIHLVLRSQKKDYATTNGQPNILIDDYDKNKARLRVESFQRYSPTLIYNVGSKDAICLNNECLELVWRDRLREELAFLYLNPNSSLGKAFANKTIESFKISIERPNDKGCVITQDNPCMIVKAKYVDPSIKYLNMYMNGPRTPERDSLRDMYTNYIQAQILAAEALGLVDVASDLKILLEYIVSDPAQLDMERVTTRISNGTNELFKNTNSGQNNEEAKKKIDEAHVYAARAGGEGQLFFNAITAIFGSGSFEDAAAAAEVASRTKGNLAYFYQALNKIREAKNINLEPETQEEFGDAESMVEI